MPRAVAVLLVALLSSAVCVAQTPPGFPSGFPQPPRDTSAQPPATAIIRGHVFDGASGQPLRKAQVRAFSPELRENRLAITDNNGAYEIKNIAAGRYTLNANKGSYVNLQYGQTRPFEQGKPLEVLNGQTVEKIDFKLPRGAVVTGRVVDENGEALSDVQVVIMRYQYVAGRRQLQPGRFGTTNDIGEFRLFGIPPGQYFVTATLRTPGGPNDAPTDDRSGYAPTYYPGTTNVSEAQRITLTVGQTMSDINIALTPTRLARISGAAVDSDGKPLQSAIILLAQMSGPMIISSIGSQMKPDGTFTIANVAPGEYVVRAMVNTGNLLTASQELIQANVTVSGDDINDLRLVGVKPSTLR